MPANFKGAEAKLVLAFLEKAAADDYFRGELENLPRLALKKLLRGYGVDVSSRDIKDAPRAVPSKAQCRQLIKMFKLGDNAFAKSQYDYNSSTVAPLILVVAFAMPLMPTEESEA